MLKDTVPSVHFYDNDFVSMYNRSWVWIDELWKTGSEENKFNGEYLSYPRQKTFHQFYSCMSSLFLVYGAQNYSPFDAIDFFYSKQEENGAIRGEYSIEDGKLVQSADNPESVHPPLFAFIEYGFYHKVGNKKRLKEVVEILEKHFDWLSIYFKKENGLYSVPISACMSENIKRDKAYYPIDFNAIVALNALYLSNIGDILNDKELSFRYKRIYFSLKTKINSKMWDEETRSYYDLDIKENQIKKMFLGSYWTLLAQIPNDERAWQMIEVLKDPDCYGTENPFSSITTKDKDFCEQGDNLNGGVSPFYNYIVIKGLQQYGEFEYARECASRHLYFIIDTLNPDAEVQGDVWSAYQPNKEGMSIGLDNRIKAKDRFLVSVALITITLMIENIIGLEISLPKKTVDWVMSSLEAMGIGNLKLKRNNISILSNKNTRGWEIRLESEKLYYFTINILDENKKKTLPIPSGKCSMLIDKL